MKILIPIDGSIASINALKKAIEIAKSYNFSIKLISVVDINNLPNYSRNDKFWRQVDGSIITQDAKMPKENEAVTKMKDNATELLEDIVSEFDLAGISVEKAVLVGEPSLKILETAKNEKFDLIVMGNRGFSKIKRFFIGSVTQRVISEAPCPVLAIHEDVVD
ncbi:universal stress protein [Acetobacterium paludosum]|uniref:Universal stress protein n=1 Tax=Acetobacterium paludosum TaxID=52693 RepID=A0A923HWU9_9FIRM|nr:universal stress protein [Acetobacterium paludosum]MBC3889771.1 universal stress protein [Acetobacterium paludosum]